MSNPTFDILFALLLIFCIIACAFAPTVDEKSDKQAMGVIQGATIIAAIIFVASIILLIPSGFSKKFRTGVLDIDIKTYIMLAAAGLLSTISLAAVWNNPNNAKATWVLVMNGLGTAFYGASAAALVVPHINVDGKDKSDT
jgi:O-antigen ligase